MTTTSERPAGPPSGPRSGGRSTARANIGARTLRTDRWWLPPLISATIFSLFVIYTSIRIFIPKYYWVDEYHYLTPVFSPCISESCVEGSSDFGQWLPKLPFFIPLPFLVFPILSGFRLTCYYYRKMYYRSFWLSPPACAVAEPHKSYSGETRFPLVVQNAHRYFWYLASALLLINTYDAAHAFFPRSGGFGVGLGSLILLTNVIMLWGYTLSCHACRHIAGGRLKHFSKHPVRYWAWTKISVLNGKHAQFAWASLISVMVTDVYVMAVSAGWISDLRLFN